MSKCDCQWLPWIQRCYGHCKPKQAQLLDLSITKDAATVTKNVEEVATVTEDAREVATITKDADKTATDAKEKAAKVLSIDSECECYGSESYYLKWMPPCKGLAHCPIAKTSTRAREDEVVSETKVAAAVQPAPIQLLDLSTIEEEKTDSNSKSAAQVFLEEKVEQIKARYKSANPFPPSSTSTSGPRLKTFVPRRLPPRRTISLAIRAPPVLFSNAHKRSSLMPPQTSAWYQGDQSIASYGDAIAGDQYFNHLTQLNHHDDSYEEEVESDSICEDCALGITKKDEVEVDSSYICEDCDFSDAKEPQPSDPSIDSNGDAIADDLRYDHATQLETSAKDCGVDIDTESYYGLCFHDEEFEVECSEAATDPSNCNSEVEESGDCFYY